MPESCHCDGWRGPGQVPPLKRFDDGGLLPSDVPIFALHELAAGGGDVGTERVADRRHEAGARRIAAKASRSARSVVRSCGAVSIGL